MTENTHTLPDGNIRRLERSRSDRMVAGVAGGLARYFDIHPAVYRVGFVVLTLLGGAGIIIYLALALVIPEEGKEDSFATAALRNRRERPWPLIGLALLAIAGAVLLSHATLWPQGDAWIPLLLAGGAILWITRHSSKTPATTDAAALAAEDSRRMRRVLKGIAIAFATLIALFFVAAAVFASIFHVHLGNGVGDRNYVVADKQDLRSSYKLGIGDLKVDLSNVRFAQGETTVRTRVDVGDLKVIVPNDVALRVDGDAQLGQVELFGKAADGRNVDRHVAETGKRVLVLKSHVGAGRVRVMRAVR
jgi:phage shock protein PspC (stress-responsive transcriptional regulator)